MKILCVDDNEGLLYLLRDSLEALSYDVTTCVESKEALILLESGHFDALILDQEMPSMSGLEIIKQAKKLATLPPIIMVTGAGNEAIAVESMRLGASDYVVKDANLVYLKILPSVIQQVIHERELSLRQQKAERETLIEKERSRLLTQFILDASHEFRIPLTIIQSSGELLERLVAEPKPQTYVKRILQQSNRILSLVDHLIELSMVDNVPSLELLPVELNALLKNVLARNGNLIAQKMLTLQLDLTDETVVVCAEANELSTALSELLENACRASISASTLFVALTVEHDAATITVRDTGVGMTEEQLSHIFERFYRVDQAHTTAGFGLGLPVVSRILDLHQGTIRITSELGQGTNVVVTLPCAPSLHIQEL